MNIFVTGSDSFLGTYFRHFNKLNSCNFIYGSIYKNKNTTQFKSLYQDIFGVLKDEKIDVLLHFAAIIPRAFAEATFKDTLLPNLEMMNNLYEFALGKRVKKFIYISGFGSMNDPCNLDIKDFYTMSKVTGEHFCKMLEVSNIQAPALRISAPYGEFSKAPNVINIFIEKAIKNEDIQVYGSGSRRQYFTYAGDVTQAIELCVKKNAVGIYNIISNKSTSMLELARIIVNILNAKSRIIIGKYPDPQENYRPNYSFEKAKRELNYSPQYDIESGLKRYITWLCKSS